MEALREQLRRHKNTRSWVTCEHKVPELDDADRSLRDGIDLQGRVAEALLGYADAVSAAFEALVRAHAALEEGGLGQVEEAAPLCRALLHGFREASALARDLAAGLQVPLEAQAVAVVGHWLDEDPVAGDWGSLGKLAELQRD